jgi:hypothetical protein
MQQPDVEIDDGTGRIMISSEEGETDGKHFFADKIFLLSNEKKSFYPIDNRSLFLLSN